MDNLWVEVPGKEDLVKFLLIIHAVFSKEKKLN